MSNSRMAVGTAKQNGDRSVPLSIRRSTRSKDFGRMRAQPVDLRRQWQLAGAGRSTFSSASSSGERARARLSIQHGCNSRFPLTGSTMCCAHSITFGQSEASRMPVLVKPCLCSAQMCGQWTSFPVTLYRMGTEIGKRLRWVQLVEQGKSCGQVCLHCGISRPTLRKWVARYRAVGPGGLESQSRRPHRWPASKVSEHERAWIAELRQRGLGSRRIQSELKRNYDLELSRPTLEKVFRSLEPRPRL